MKWIFATITAAVLTTGCAKTKTALVQAKPLTKAQYVEANHCKIIGRVDVPPIYVDGRVSMKNGWAGYQCPSGVHVVINDDEDQPKSGGH
jgi:hypothetical protein